MPITKVTKDIEKVCKQYKALHTRNSDVFPKYLKSMNTVNKQFKKGHITAIEYFQKIDLLVLGLTKLGFGSRRFVNDEMEDLINLLNK